jgi:hypothetical protein
MYVNLMEPVTGISICLDNIASIDFKGSFRYFLIMLNAVGMFGEHSL